MRDTFSALRQKVLEAVEEQHRAPHQMSPRHPRVLAEFIRLQMTKLSLSERQLAQQIDLPVEQVRLLLHGALPLSILTEDLLQQIASVVDCDVSLMQIILNRADSGRHHAAEVLSPD